MSKRLKIFGTVIIVIAVIALMLSSFWLWFTRRAFPKTSGTVQIAGINQPVEILRDEYGVAHIYAHTPEDLFFAQGYVHAQDRFWQMEFQRRTGAGRLSEIFGEATLSTDRYLRHFRFRDLSEQTYNLLDEDGRGVIDAYSAGVNAYIGDRSPSQLGLEFALLGLQGVKFDIEEWTSADSLIWAEMMIFDQSDQLRTELTNIDLLASVGLEMYNHLRPSYRDDRPVIIPSEELETSSLFEPASSVGLGEAEIRYLLELKGKLNGNGLPPQLAASGFMSFGGSNSFAISGDKTTTGKPLLANDPHMDVSMPSIWYEVGMHCVEKSAQCIYNFRGFSLVGVPGILIGHNDRIAWGLTNASFDAEDVFIERINPENPNQYQVNGTWVDMEIHREEIVVRGQDEPVVMFVRSTRNGVVATDYMMDQTQFSFSEDGLELYALTYAWTALEPVQSIRAVLGVNRAQNWDDFVEALRYFDAGKQNWLYADVDGNIGFVMPGKVPIRAGGDGSLPVPGWNDDYRWVGFIPYDELPKTFNPEQGFIATANNPQIRAEVYPYLLSVSHDRGQRAQRITEMIENDRDGISIEDLIAIQTDNQDLSALEILPYLKDLVFDDPDVSAARDRLLNWDAQMHMDSPEAALYNIFWVQLIAETFHDQLPEDLYPSGNHATRDTFYFLLQDAGNPWWDDITTPDRIEDRYAILVRAFEQAYAGGVKEFGRDFTDWRWGDLHTTTFRNATLGSSGIGLIENIFNRGPFATSGSESVIQKTGWNANNPYQVTSIPALRQIVDLGNLSDSLMIQSVGQSGHPMHPRYDDFIDLWRLFEYHPSNWSRADTESGDYDLLELKPAP